MYLWRGAAVLFGILLVMACSHPLEIKGEGDILSASGTRNCYLENFQAGAESCSKNLVVGEYRETYYAVPRDGWEFISWEHCFDDGSVADQCRFDYDQSVVKQFWGETAAPLVAVFQQHTPPPKPVAMYSYALDEDGLLINPLPLEGARLERKAVYFTFTGNYELVKFWCCKVPDGQEAHNEPVEDRVPPFCFASILARCPMTQACPVSCMPICLPTPPITVGTPPTGRWQASVLPRQYLMTAERIPSITPSREASRLAMRPLIWLMGRCLRQVLSKMVEAYRYLGERFTGEFIIGLVT